jgi:cation diffusion facilitator CzcD-associated flavoprotein CzcO
MQPSDGAGRLPAQTDIAIVGAGIAGLNMAIALKQAGYEDVLVIERADEVGGTWEANTYPGCQCDIPSNLYSYSFAPKPDWSRTFPSQPEIWAYLRKVADDFGVRPHIRLGCELIEAVWEEPERSWRLETSLGSTRARLLIPAIGNLCEPSIPDVPGLESFEGAAFHTARWDHDHDLSGRRVAVVGTGASVIQVVPNIQPQVASLTVFQRTPPWIFPQRIRQVRSGEQRLFRLLPAAQRAVRAVSFWPREFMTSRLTHRRMGVVFSSAARMHLKREVADPELRRKLTPDYAVGCKRMLLSGEYYPALQKANVELIAEAVAEVRPDGVVSANGHERKVDTIIWGTGFRTARMPIGNLIRGREGRLLDDVWLENGTRALRGTAIAGFPNLFLLGGPNTVPGANTAIYLIESQVRYVLDAVRKMDARGARVVEARQEAVDTFNEMIQRATAGTVWVSGGCRSWYLDHNGHNTMLWPGTCRAFRRATERFDPAEYLAHA